MAVAARATILQFLNYNFTQLKLKFCDARLSIRWAFSCGESQPKAMAPIGVGRCIGDFTVRQLDLFDRNLPEIPDDFEPVLDRLDRDTLRAGWASMKVAITGAGELLVSLPLELTSQLNLMAEPQKQNYRSTSRGADHKEWSNLFSRAALAKWAGIDADSFFHQWKNALGVGDGGKVVPTRNGWFGVRATLGGKRNFVFSVNKGTAALAGFAFAQVLKNHSGAATVLTLGSAALHDCWDSWRMIGDGRATVDIDALPLFATAGLPVIREAAS